MSSWIDISQTYQSDMPGFSDETAKVLERDGWNAKTLHIYSHAGTHMDAPFHFGAGSYLEEIPPHRFISRAWKVHCPTDEPQRLLTVEHIASQLSSWQKGDSLLIETGWSRYQGSNWAYYRDKLPRVSPELARWCVDQEVNILGVEPPSVADVHKLEEVTLIHKILLGGNVIIIEGLCNLSDLPDGPFELYAFPLKVNQSDGAPARVLVHVT